MKYDDVSTSNCSIVGFGYFIAYPYLWIGVLFAALLSLLVIISSTQVIFRTLRWHLFCSIATLFSLFGPLALFLAQVGMEHIAIIDAADLVHSRNAWKTTNQRNKKPTVSCSNSRLYR